MKKHSKQPKVSIRRVLCVSILIIGISAFSTMRVNATNVSYNPPTYSALTPHDPIHITSDIGFEIFPGTGTAEDPYVIEGYSITTTSPCGIYITDTTEFFVIRNCYVDVEDSGIFIGKVASGTTTVINNTCNNHNYYGIRINYSSNSTIINNTCNNNDNTGILLESSGSSNVESNTCNNNNFYYAIYLDSSGSSTVINNTCSNNYWAGIHLSSSSSSTVANNTCNSNNNRGIYLLSSGSSTVESNTCSNNDYIGISLSFSGSLTVESNTCSNNLKGILLESSWSSIVINNTCNNNDYGIYLESSDFCVVTYNHLQENEGYGVYLTLENGIFVSSSDNNLIHHNTFVDNNLGGTSQAKDGGTNNTWYDSETQEGNYWSDWSGKGSYAIDGSADSEDLYPLDEPAEYSTDKTQIFFTFTLLIVIVPLLLTKLFSRRRR